MEPPPALTGGRESSAACTVAGRRGRGNVGGRRFLEGELEVAPGGVDSDPLDLV